MSINRDYTEEQFKGAVAADLLSLFSGILHVKNRPEQTDANSSIELSHSFSDKTTGSPAQHAAAQGCIVHHIPSPID